MEAWVAVLSQRLINIVVSVMIGLTISACASVPLDTPKVTSAVFVDTENTQLAQASNNWRAEDLSRNGFYPLIEGMDAFGARLALMDRAERSIDAQYFLMKPDAAGLVFSAKLLEAAERGVRVRFLLDDIFTTVDDRALIVLDQHPNIELRIFNPISRSGFYFFNFLGYFDQVNRRMHNKSFTVDNQVTVVGGRNIAEEYFQLQAQEQFFDFDMFCAGPVVNGVSAAFDTYWNHHLAVPMEVFYGQHDSDDLEQVRNRIKQAMQDTGQSIYARAIDTQLMRDFYNGDLEPYIANAKVIIDKPQKLLEEIAVEHQIVATAIVEALNSASNEIIIFTPYFIPGDDGVEILKAITAKGVRVILVTNSLATNNHTVVHSAYSSYRTALLEAGVELWETRADAAEIELDDGSKNFERLTLHTKAIMIDRRYLFVGSLNLDPRSIDINTEMGVMIDAEHLASELTDYVLQEIPAMAYQLVLDEDGLISWHANIDGQPVVETSEPQTSIWRRFKAWFLQIAPEKQL